MKSYSLSGAGFPNLKVLTMKGRKGRFHPTGGCGGPMPNLNKKAWRLVLIKGRRRCNKRTFAKVVPMSGTRFESECAITFH